VKLNIDPFDCRLPITIAILLLFITIYLTGANSSYAGPSNSESQAMGEAPFAEHLDAHFAMLHEKLMITRDQEDQWRKFTDVMRENTKIMKDLNDKRRKDVKTMTALEDLKSYSEIADAHATGLKKFIPAFETLYGTMSEEQRKNADSLFLGQREMMSDKMASK
jgi:hypothetical protein